MPGQNLIRKILLFLTREEALKVFRTVFPIGFRCRFQGHTDDPGHAATFPRE
jgi:hypothetical protein